MLNVLIQILTSEKDVKDTVSRDVAVTYVGGERQ